MASGRGRQVIIVECPVNRPSARRYALDLILKERLGLKWKWRPSTRRAYRISVAGVPGRSLRLPDRLLSVSDQDWLQPASLPRTPLARWQVPPVDQAWAGTDGAVPVIYGKHSPVGSDDGLKVSLPLDVPGSVFFMCSRYEEWVLPDRDEHGRFPSHASVAGRCGFLTEPIVDHYIELLWAAMHRLWPHLRRRETSFRTMLSHDVDRPYLEPLKSLKDVATDVHAALRGENRPATREEAWLAGREIVDPHFALRRRTLLTENGSAFRWLLDLAARHGLRSAFYFLGGVTDPQRDASYAVGHPALRGLMVLLRREGHEIGLHPSYASGTDITAIRREFRALRRACAFERIWQAKWGARMHYLRWIPKETARTLDKAGLDYDATLTYADHIGFRCGTCHEFPGFDHVTGKPMRLRLRPLIAMDVSVTSRIYMNLGFGEAAFTALRDVKEACRAVNGNFTLLWHDNRLATEEERHLLAEVVSA